MLSVWSSQKTSYGKELNDGIWFERVENMAGNHHLMFFLQCFFLRIIIARDFDV